MDTIRHKRRLGFYNSHKAQAVTVLYKVTKEKKRHSSRGRRNTEFYICLRNNLSSLWKGSPSVRRKNDR